LFWSYGEYELVGHGKQTNSGCGKFLGFRGCARVDLHNMITLDGVNYSGKVFVQKVHCTCHKPTCPVCYKHGWAVREAKRIEARLSECSKRFGQVEHIIVSVPQRDYGLSLEALRHKVVQKIMKKRGIIGGVLIFHVFLYLAGFVSFFISLYLFLSLINQTIAIVSLILAVSLFFIYLIAAFKEK
jgi:hypothetical protein